jgi:hypothetical protein
MVDDSRVGWCCKKSTDKQSSSMNEKGRLIG